MRLGDDQPLLKVNKRFGLDMSRRCFMLIHVVRMKCLQANSRYSNFQPLICTTPSMDRFQGGKTVGFEGH